MFDITSFILGYILGATTFIWFTAIFIDREKIQAEIKENWQTITSKLIPPKQAQVIKREDPIDELLNPKTK